jgi:hypothetical protein
MSIYYIRNIASKARFATPPPSASASVSACRVIFQERPQRSLQAMWLGAARHHFRGAVIVGKDLLEI